MKKIYACILTTGFLMHSSDLVCSSEEPFYQTTEEVIIKVACIASTCYLFYKLGSVHKNKLNKKNKHMFDFANKSLNANENTQCISMDLVEARMNLKKTGFNTRNNLSMPRLELTPEAKLELRQENKDLQDQVRKYYRHHGYKN